MPLRKDSKRRSDIAESDSKTVDATSVIDCDRKESDNCKEKDDEDDEDDDETQDAWLESLGIENSEIKKINHSQVCNKYTINVVRSQFDLILRTILGENDFGERK